jgi:hypothetical protein
MENAISVVPCIKTSPGCVMLLAQRLHVGVAQGADDRQHRNHKSNDDAVPHGRRVGPEIQRKGRDNQP